MAMKAGDLDILVQEGEGTTLEFKEGLSSSFARELVAMANTIGGKILLGVGDDGTVVGVSDSNRLRSRIQDIARNCDPPVRIRVEPVDSVLIVHVRESATKPVHCGEGFFWRQGAVTQKLSRNEIRDFFRAEGAIRFDLSPCPHFRYPEDFDGGVVSDLEEAMRFIERNTRTAWRIDGLRRENIPEYPMRALREAITNAVMHRDWFMEGANVFVELYSDRIEVSSPGGLPKGMTLEDLGHKSVRRNTLIADLLHRIGFIEKAGTGIRRIRDEARAGGYPEPQFSETGFLTATFYPKDEVRVQVQAHKREEAPPIGTKLALSRHQVEILHSCREEQPLVELLGLAGRSDRTKFRNQVLKPLLAENLIEMTIPDKPRSSKQRYRLTSKGRAFLEDQTNES